MTRRLLSLPRNRRRGAGVGLVTAIFLLVVLSGLAVALVMLSSAQQAGSALDVQGARALQAARAGIEWGVFRKLRDNHCAASTTITLPAASSLNGFVAIVTCRVVKGPVNAAGDADALDRWEIESTACNLLAAGVCQNAGNSADYVQRRIQVRL